MELFGAYLDHNTQYFVTLLQPPAALYEGAVAAGAAKASASWSKIFKLGIVSGAHIGFGSYLAITVGGACPGIASANPGLQKVRLLLNSIQNVVRISNYILTIILLNKLERSFWEHLDCPSDLL